MMDLNSDLGEGIGNDSFIIPFITSANICCNEHAGNEIDILKTISLCKNVTIGAHPGYSDRINFGRKEIVLEQEQIYDIVISQVKWLQERADVKYIKPHGALYNQGCKNKNIADPINAVSKELKLPLLTLPNTYFDNQFNEGFLDRRYDSKFQFLLPRSEKNSLINDPFEAFEQAMNLNVHSFCVHGDNPKAIEFVEKVRLLLEVKHEIKSFI